MKEKLFLILPLLIITTLSISNVDAQVGTGDSPFERKFGDVKFLDASFGTETEKIEVNHCTWSIR